MWILNGMIIIAIALFMQLPGTHAQAGNACTAAAIATCAPYTCVQTDIVFSCLCPNMQLAQSAAACGGIVASTQFPPVIPNQCGIATCPAGATCIGTSQNPLQYVCLCPNNVLANPDCPINPPPNNVCLLNNPCRNGGTCAINPLTNQAICICPPNSYGPNCSSACLSSCVQSW